ncbi:BolA family protein [Oligella urethralis]|uniref:BolA family transcriptional regulator n=1 Tax=Oligella urethralis DNF00040 TaxID=1401065 RepID=A0A096BH08_9BURK|nr:BolA family protein [Oligella urethralis]KGF32409.1 BolA family transcriptional regulator [Oligella urethralis DNF00040]
MNEQIHSSLAEERVEMIRQRLAVLEPIELEVSNNSHLHAQHAGNRDGANHFTVTMRSAKFDGITRVQRQRLVYAELQDLMPFPIHALALKLVGSND